MVDRTLDSRAWTACLRRVLDLGAGAADFAASQGPASAIPASEVQQALDDSLAPFGRTEGENPYELQSDLQRLMQADAGIVRDQDGLQRAVGEVQKLAQRARKVAVVGSREYNPGWNTAIDLRSLLTVSEAVARAGAARAESRGAHTRLDFPDSEPRLERVELVIRKENGQMSVSERAQPEVPADLANIIKEGR